MPEHILKQGEHLIAILTNHITYISINQCRTKWISLGLHIVSGPGRESKKSKVFRFSRILFNIEVCFVTGGLRIGPLVVKFVFFVAGSICDYTTFQY